MRSCAVSVALLAIAVGVFHQVNHVHFPMTRRIPAPSWNWDGKVQLASSNHTVQRPCTVGEVQRLVREASEQGSKVKVIGAGHSWSTIAAPVPGSVVLSLDCLCKINGWDSNSEVVTVQGGMRLAELYEELAKKGRALHNVPSVNEQSIAGAISTATHGSGATHRSVSSAVVRLQLVDGRGQLRSFSAEEQPELLPAVRVGLGALGVIVSVSLQTVPVSRTMVHEFTVPSSSFLSNISEFIVDSGHSSKAWMLPHTESTVVMSQVRVAGDGSGFDPTPAGVKLLPPVQAAGRSRDLTQDFSTIPDAVSTAFSYVVESITLLTSLAPSARRWSNLFLEEILFELPKTRVARSDRVQIIPFRIPPHTEMEYAVPGVACSDALQQLREWMARAELYSEFVHEVRFVARDGDWLSMAYHPAHDPSLAGPTFDEHKHLLSEREKRLCSPEAKLAGGPSRALLCDSTCHITIGLGHASEAELSRYFNAFEDICLKLGGRPHWAKRFQAPPEAMQAMYPRMKAWEQLRSELDPYGTFMNHFLQAVLK